MALQRITGNWYWDSGTNKVIKEQSIPGAGPMRDSTAMLGYDLLSDNVPADVRNRVVELGYAPDPAVAQTGGADGGATGGGGSSSGGDTGFASSLYSDLFSNLPPAMQDLLRNDKDTQREFMAALAGASISESLATRAEQRQEKKAEEAKQSRSAFITGQSPLLSGEQNRGAQLAREGGGFTNFDSAGMRSVRAGAGGAGLLAQGKEGGAPDEGTVGSANQPINNFRTTMNVLREQRGY